MSYSLKRREINSYSQASLSSGKLIKCLVSLISRMEKKIGLIKSCVSCFFTYEPYHGDSHSCPTGSVSRFKRFSKIIQIRSTDCFQRRMSLKNEREKICRVCNFCWGICWRHEKKKKKTKRVVQLFEERTKREKYTRLGQQNWTSTLQS